MANDTPVEEVTRTRTMIRRRLIELRLRRGIPIHAVGVTLGWSISKTRNIESGRVGVTRTDLREMLALYQLHDSDEIERLVSLTHKCNALCRHH